MKKLPNSVSTEDLLKALEGNADVAKPTDEIFDYRDDIPLFLSKYNIQAGENSVAKTSLYSLYVRYSETPLPRHQFKISLLNFVPEMSDHTYGLNKTRTEITTLIQKSKPKVARYTPASATTRKHFELFLSENNITPGSKWIDGFSFLYIYQKWCRANRKIIRFKPKSFIKIANLYFENKKTTYINNWFKVNESLVQTLTEEDRRKIKHDREKRNEHKEWREKKEKG